MDGQATSTGAISVDLTATGVSDWAQWALTTATSFNHKAEVPSQISNISATDSRWGGNGNLPDFSWTDGTPTASAANFSGGAMFNTPGGSYEFTVAADTSPRTLTVYVSGFRSGSRVEATLSDGSAAPYSIEFQNLSGPYQRAVTIDYSAASSGQTLTFRHTFTTPSSLGSGNIVLQAATLQGGGQGGGGNSAPNISPIGNRTVTVDSPLTFTVTAVDPDGPAPLTMSISNSVPALPAAATYVDTGGGTGAFDWTPVAADVGNYSVTFAASEAGVDGQTTEQTINIEVRAEAAGGGLTASVASIGAISVDLTAEGVSDWAQWALTTATSFNHKAGVSSQISNINVTGLRWGGNGNLPDFSWTDGTPTVSAANFSGGAMFTSLGGGYEFTVAADTNPRTLTVYVAGFRSGSRIEATLSDGSAAPYSIDVQNLNGSYRRAVTIDYSASSSGQTLTFRHTFTTPSSLGSGNIVLQAATLQGGGQGGGGNSAPNISPIGNRTVTVDSPLTFTVTAVDPDGPAPLTMSISNSVPALPAAATYVDTGGGTGAFDWTPVAADVGNYSVTFAASEAGVDGQTTEQTINIEVRAEAAGGGLTASVASIGAISVDLTAEGVSDWAQWALTTATSFNHKAGVSSQISNINATGLRWGGNGNLPDFSWTDGTPTASAANFSGGAMFTSLGGSYEFTVTADTNPRTLTVYVAGFRSGSRIEATLSDGSAAPYSIDVQNLNGSYRRAVTIDYSAASSGQTLTFRHTFTTPSSLGSGNIVLQAATLQGASPSFSLPFSESFENAGALSAWNAIDETANTAIWQVVSGELRQLARVVAPDAFDQTYHQGSYLYLASALSATDYKFSVTGRYLAEGSQDDIGILFRYQNPDNYYRLSLSSRYGFTRLEKKVSGVFSPMAMNSRAYAALENLLFDVEVRGQDILVWINGDPVFAASDGSIASGSVGLYTQNLSSFDTVELTELDSQPKIVLSRPLAYSVSSTSSIAVSAIAANVPPNGYVEFILDGDASSSRQDTTSPFNTTFDEVAPGNHSVAAVLLVPGTELARDTNEKVGSDGELSVAIGDSLIQGFGDGYATDNVTVQGRIIAAQGFQAVTTDALDSSRPNPTNLIVNEGISGDESVDAAFTRIDSILARYPTIDRAIIGLGNNDVFAGVPSGRNCSGAACQGKFKGNMQTLIDKIRWTDYPNNTVPSGIAVTVSLIPPAFTATNPWNTNSNNLIREFNDVIRLDLDGIELGPDFFSFFMPGPTTNYSNMFVDALHPNGLGYMLKGYLWHNALNPNSVLPIPFFLEDLQVISTNEVKQNLIEVGDDVYLDEAFAFSSIPADILNGRWVQTNNADRSTTVDSYLTFTVDRPVTVYIAYDSDAAQPPDWMAGYSSASDQIETDNPGAPFYDLYKRVYPAGPIVLGGNRQGNPSSTAENYLTIVVEN